ncbi:MAG: 2-amino-4-hydroxy-6-hydroxymethyldihydropteridine diphosphokinase [Pseudomonadota bacterium]
MDFDHIAYIGFGSNIGDRKANCMLALDILNCSDVCRITKLSSLYETEPIGYANQNWFINGVAQIQTNLEPKDLINRIKKIEQDMGRNPCNIRFGPRIIDLDILLFDNLAAEYDDLILPHPELHRRRFVLAPLSEIAADVVHPLLKETIYLLLVRLNEDKIVKCLS